MSFFTVTWRDPAIAAAGVVTVMWVSSTKAEHVPTGQSVAPKKTSVAPVNPIPPIVTDCPPANGPLDGVTLVTTGRTLADTVDGIAAAVATTARDATHSPPTVSPQALINPCLRTLLTKQS